MNEEYSIGAVEEVGRVLRMLERLEEVSSVE